MEAVLDSIDGAASLRIVASREGASRVVASVPRAQIGQHSAIDITIIKALGMRHPRLPFAA
jgi:hypothetical protein